MPPEEESMPARRLAVSLGAVALTGAALIGSGTAVAGAAVAGGTASAGAAATPQVRKGIVPPKNPKRSLAPSPNFLGRPSCARGGDGRRCNTIVLRAITHARKVLEKMGAMHFPLAAYEKLTRNEQLFVTVNLERAARGMRPVTELTRSLNRVAQIGANADADPPLNQVPRTLPGGGHPVAGTTRSAPTTAGCTSTGRARTTGTAPRPTTRVAGATATTSWAGSSPRRPAVAAATRPSWAPAT
jgi:hypothetical protein